LKFILRNSEWPDGIEQGVRDLLAQKHRHDVLEEVLRELEQNEKIDSVGYGGIPNILGQMELDAAFMNGDNRMVGAVGAVSNFLPVRIARRLMERGLHTMLVGDGAERFARVRLAFGADPGAPSTREVAARHQTVTRGRTAAYGLGRPIG
jgi:isoaspartyl peptidase/L-asparaginase-like protein (Ntn-hydrolase superfamily)